MKSAVRGAGMAKTSNRRHLPMNMSTKPLPLRLEREDVDSRTGPACGMRRTESPDSRRIWITVDGEAPVIEVR